MYFNVYPFALGRFCSLSKNIYSEHFGDLKNIITHTRDLSANEIDKKEYLTKLCTNLIKAVNIYKPSKNSSCLKFDI